MMYWNGEKKNNETMPNRLAEMVNYQQRAVVSKTIIDEGYRNGE